MRCEQIQELLSPYMDGMTNEKEKQAVTAHIENCDQCRMELEQLKKASAILCGLDTPQLPEGFAEDLHTRLIDEYNSILRHREVKRPKKQGWIAASVAGIALMIGIFASSYLPTGTIVALWNNKDKDTDAPKPRLAVEDIIKNIADQSKPGSKNEETGKVDVAEKGSPGGGVTVPEKTSNTTPGKQAPAGNNQEKPETPVVKVTPKIAEVYATSVKVDSAGGTLPKVVKLAESNHIPYSYIDNSSRMQAFSGSNTKGVLLKVAPDEVDNVLGQLQGIGKASGVNRNQVELTGQYTETVKQIASLEQQKQALQSQGNLSAEDQKKLAEVNHNLDKWSAKKATLDNELKTVTLEVYLVENIAP
ncbi:MAG: zf-HC2 domain-containing protein [Syntrophomonadaceae bacterium]|nr:zf-HC2 domain-containing protein [Syntrophomonadaceae bacterium]MDD3889099.1 zf-HC2 domain-containing protein [Syntrophomonadaceae bacterium]MDD4549376.1 zf-HC2 domain-containing protein [Syntrophomonadaceae bacterium]